MILYFIIGLSVQTLDMVCFPEHTGYPKFIDRLLDEKPYFIPFINLASTLCFPLILISMTRYVWSIRE
ncbi:MAG: hypothetical protein ABIQ31_11130 [Ferruginibacter sp.]